MVDALIDSGSQITCMSEDFYKELILKTVVEELPTTNMQVITAISQKKTTIKKQIRVTFHISTMKYDSIFLIIPHLSSKIIFGNDWLFNNKIVLDYEKESIIIDGKMCDGDQVIFGSNLLKGSEFKDPYTQALGMIEFYREIVPNALNVEIPNNSIRLSKESIGCDRGCCLNDCKDDEIVKLNVIDIPVKIDIKIDDKSKKVETQILNNEYKNRCFEVNDKDNTQNICNNEIKLKKRKSIKKKTKVNLIYNENENIHLKDICKNLSVDNTNENVVIDYENVSNSVVVNPDKNVYEVSEFTSEPGENGEQYRNNLPTVDRFLTPTVSTLPVMEGEIFEESLKSIELQMKHLRPDQSEAVLGLVTKYRDVFSNKPGCATSYQHDIRLLSNKPFVKRSYPIPLAFRNAVDAEIEAMLEAGVIERSNSPYCNPLRIVKKKDGRVRLCLDARALNEVIEGDNESPPLIAELMQKHHGTEFFTTLDMTHGYWQIELSERSRPYTAFLHGSTLYQFRRVPFGLKTAGSAFIRALSLAFGTQFQEFLTYYIDDLLLSSVNFQQHLIHLEHVFIALRAGGFTLRLDKAKFFQHSVMFLGYQLTREGIMPDPDRLKVIENFDNPRNKVDLQKFLGICTYYRQFNISHANYVDPFRKLLKKGEPWKWTSEHSEAFRLLKNRFLNCIRLYHFDPKREFYIQTDASDKGVGAVLFQKFDQGDQRVVSVISRGLCVAEIHYTTTEKELLAIVYAVMKFRFYLIGQKFTIITDHKALVFLHTTPYQTARLARWSIFLQEYEFDIMHCKGSENIVADFFSRNPDSQFHSDSSSNMIISALQWQLSCMSSFISHDDILINICSLQKHDVLMESFHNIGKLQRDDPELIRCINKIEAKGQNFVIEYEGVWFCKGKGESAWNIVIPEILRFILFRDVHSRLGHPGVSKTLTYLRRFFWWKGIARDLKKWVLKCDMCQRVKYLSYKMEGEFCMVSATAPNDLITVDFYGPLPRSTGGVQYIFVVLDAFTKLVTLYPIKKATTIVVLNKILNNYIEKRGLPARILSDNGRQFASPKWKRALEGAGIKVIYSSIRHPQSNPTERVMRELGRLFRTFTSLNHKGWAKFVPTIENLLNITTHTSTGFAPIELHFNETPRDRVLDVVCYPKNDVPAPEVKIFLARENIKNRYEQRRKQQRSSSSVILNVGDKVLIRVPRLSNALDAVTHKFFHVYEGPYLLTQACGSNAFRVSDINNPTQIKGTYNRLSLRKYYESTEPLQNMY